MRYNGITLIELLIVLAVISILIAIAYPSFSHLLASHHRKEAEQTLLIMAKNMEVYKIQNHSYTGVTINDVKPANLPVDHFYQYSISALTAESFQLTAEPSAQQLKNDQECGALTINELGVRGSNNKNSCWGT